MWCRAVSSRLFSSAAVVGAACGFQQSPGRPRRCVDIRSSHTFCRCELQKPIDTKSVDVVVLGGGIVGASTALYLAEAGRNVLLVETQAVGSGATGMSCATVASVGAGDGSDARASMVHWTMQALRELQGQADAGDHDLDCAFVECGALEMLHTEEELEKALASVEDLQRHGYEAQVLSTAAAEQLEPALKGSPGLLGVMYMPKSGYADPCKTMQALEKRATEAGVELWEGWEAVAASRNGHEECGKTWLVEMASRSQNSRSKAASVSCSHVVLATGAWANATGKIFGLEVPVARVKAQMWSATAGDTTAAKLSNIIYSMSSHLFWAQHATQDLSTGTPNGVTHSAEGTRYCYHVYGRPSCLDSQEVCFGGDRLPLSLHQAPSDYDVNPAEQQENFQHIAHTLPALELQEADPGGWCGVVGSSLHGGVLIGEVAFLPGLWLCTGFGGSGFMQGIGAGKAISEWIAVGSERSKTSFPALQVAADPTPWLRSSSVF